MKDSNSMLLLLNVTTTRETLHIYDPTNSNGKLHKTHFINRIKHPLNVIIYLSYSRFKPKKTVIGFYAKLLSIFIKIRKSSYIAAIPSAVLSHFDRLP